MGSLAFTLGLLIYYKYAALLLTTLLPVLASLGWESTAVPEVFLPLGISFYSFQIIALAVDTYRSAERKAPTLSRYALFVCFFPQLIAGPILRGDQLLPQLDRGGELTHDRTRRGLWLLAVGISKKVVMADFLLAPFVNEVFGALLRPLEFRRAA